jgi:hypothetical protein
MLNTFFDNTRLLIKIPAIKIGRKTYKYLISIKIYPPTPRDCKIAKKIRIKNKLIRINEKSIFLLLKEKYNRIKRKIINIIGKQKNNIPYDPNTTVYADSKLPMLL